MTVVLGEAEEDTAEATAWPAMKEPEVLRRFRFRGTKIVLVILLMEAAVVLPSSALSLTCFSQIGLTTSGLGQAREGQLEHDFQYLDELHIFENDFIINCLIYIA